MRSIRPTRLNWLLSWLVVGTIGAVEGIYGRTQYLGDWISYLNVSRAVSALDWRGIFDPMWSPGYPILVAMMRAVFPHTAEGEWYAITLLNWLIFLAAFACWRYLIRTICKFHMLAFRGYSERFDEHPIVVWTANCAFLSCMLCLVRVSSANPDMLISTLFILATALVLSLLIQGGARRTVVLGLVLGAGYWAKSVFLPYSLILLLTLFIGEFKKRSRYRTFLVAAATFVLVCTPLVAGTSWSYGRFTLGASGPLNYAFHVNHLPHWMNWQGGTPIFGEPVHPTRQLLKFVPVFAFGTPFHTTYPPYNNLAYWYEGFHNFFSPKLQLLAICRTAYFMVVIIRDHPFLWALALAVLGMLLKRDWRIALLRSVILFWPVLLPAVLGLGTYLLVHVEARYISPFCLIFGLLPIMVLLAPELKSKRALMVFLMLAYSVGAVAELRVTDGATFKAAIRNRDFHDDPQWKLAAALPLYGLRPGDGVALIHGQRAVYRCHWAYISRLRIVAELGSVPYSIAPWDRTRFDRDTRDPGDVDYELVFWKQLTPQERGEVIQAFRQTGARAIIALSKPKDVPAPGWQSIKGTDAWIYSFDTASASTSVTLTGSN